MPNLVESKNIRNVAIIAHVDHGKTTLVDAFLKQSKVFRENQEEMAQSMILDSGDLEREKGITISAKNLSVMFQGYKINVIDTPGHADFGGEVERTLTMADGCILLVDAQEGPMPQTKFVLKKALELKLKPILVINKIDKKSAMPAAILSKVSDLFLEIATDDSQLDFPVFYAIGRQGKVFASLPTPQFDTDGNPNYDHLDADITPLLSKIIEYVPAPTGDVSNPLQMQISNLEFDPHLGRLLVGRISQGTARVDDSVVIAKQDPEFKNVTGKIKSIRTKVGITYVVVESAVAGDVVAISGLETTAIGATICATGHIKPLPSIKISEPSVRIKIEANTSPFMGKEGKFVTAKQLQQRLDKEAEINIGLVIEKTDAGAYFVSGRGELQLTILLETMRREGYEFQVRRPEVIFKNIDGKKHEPIEEVLIVVDTEYQGVVNSAMSERKGELQDMQSENGSVRFTYRVLTRNLLGLRNYLLNNTKGNAVVNNFVLEYVPYTEQEPLFRRGVLLSSEPGVAMGYSLNTIQERGDLFIEGGVSVYEGMIIGINKFEQDLEVNPTKERAKSGVRIKHDEITQTSLKTPKKLTIEYALLFIKDDEMLEVTPLNIRLRKQYLTKTERDWSKRENLTEFARQKMGLTN